MSHVKNVVANIAIKSELSKKNEDFRSLLKNPEVLATVAHVPTWPTGLPTAAQLGSIRMGRVLTSRYHLAFFIHSHRDCGP